MRMEGLELASRAGVTSAQLNLSVKSPLSIRRIVGIITGICALYLTVGASDLACNNHSARVASQLTDPSMAAHGDSAHKLPVKQTEHPAPCKSPAVPCCVAMTTCAISAVAESPSSTLFPTASHSVSLLDLTKPASRIAAPEPPPPKA